MSRAERTSDQRDSGKEARVAPRRERWARETWSKLTAETTGIPSSGVSTTSVVSPRTVLVSGATMSSFSWSATSSASGRERVGVCQERETCTNESHPSSSNVLPPGSIPTERVFVSPELAIRGGGLQRRLVRRRPARQSIEGAVRARHRSALRPGGNVFSFQFALHGSSLSEVARGR